MTKLLCIDPPLCAVPPIADAIIIPFGHELESIRRHQAYEAAVAERRRIGKMVHDRIRPIRRWMYPGRTLWLCLLWPFRRQAWMR